MTPLQVIALPDRLYFAGVVEGAPDIAVQFGTVELDSDGTAVEREPAED